MKHLSLCTYRNYARRRQTDHSPRVAAFATVATVCGRAVFNIVLHAARPEQPRYREVSLGDGKLLRIGIEAQFFATYYFRCFNLICIL